MAKRILVKGNVKRAFDERAAKIAISLLGWSEITPVSKPSEIGTKTRPPEIIRPLVMAEEKPVIKPPVEVVKEVVIKPAVKEPVKKEGVKESVKKEVVKLPAAKATKKPAKPKAK